MIVPKQTAAPVVFVTAELLGLPIATQHAEVAREVAG